MHSLQIQLKPSRILSGLLLFMTGLGLASVWLAPYAWAWKGLISLLVLAACAHAVLQHGLRCLATSVLALQIDAAHTLQLTHKNGQQWLVTVRPDSVVTAYLTVIHYRAPAAHWFTLSRHLVIVADALDAEAYRRLRVHLRWAHGPT